MDQLRAESGEEEGFDSLAMAMLMDNFRPVAYNFPGIEISKNWMATLSIITDVKRAPPAGQEGWEWLFLRAVVGQCANGRYSMDVTLVDEGGEGGCYWEEGGVGAWGGEEEWGGWEGWSEGKDLGVRDDIPTQSLLLRPIKIIYINILETPSIVRIAVF